MGYFVDANRADRYFGLFFSCLDDKTCSGKICLVDRGSQQLVKLLPFLAVTVVVLFIGEIAALVVPVLDPSVFTADKLEKFHVTVLVGSVGAVLIESLVVIVAWLRAVRARSFCTVRTQLRIDWRNSYSLYLIPVVVFTNAVMVLLWVRSVPQYGPPDMLSSMALLLAIATAVAGVPRLVWLVRRRHSPDVQWRPEQ